MAFLTAYFPILLLILLSFLHVHARDGQFFSKISTNNNAKENTQLPPNKQEIPLNKQEQDPNFIPQNQQNTGYGLYGHQSGLLPPATTTRNLPYKTTKSKEPYNKDYYPNSNTYKENRQYYNNDAYFTDPQGMSDSRFMEKAYTTPITSNNNNNNNNNYYNGGNMYNSRQQGMGASKFSATNYGNRYNNGGNMYNYDKPGMSDTRFLENGRYYYDLNSENYDLNSNENSRGFESRNEYYNNRGYYGNNGNSLGSKSEYYNNRGQYGNNENSYVVNNSMEGYNQNQEEFQESQDEQFMP